MSIDVNDLRVIFGKIDGFNPTTDFYSNLRDLMLDTSGIRNHLAKFFIDEHVWNILSHEYAIGICAQAFFMISSILESNRKFESLLTLMVEPSSNFHESDLFSPVVTSLIRLVTSQSPNWISCPSLIKKEQAHFDKDRIHLSKRGEKRLFFMFKDLLNICATNFASGNISLPEIVSEITLMIERFDNTPYAANLPKRLEKREPIIRVFDRENYLIQNPSKKLMAKWSSTGKLTNGGKIDLTALNRDHMAAAHADSIFRSFISNSPHNRKLRKKGKLLPLPSTITISPGAMSYHIYKDLKDSVHYNIDISCYLSIFCIGANERFALLDIVYGVLCNYNIIGRRLCPICARSNQSYYTAHRRPKFVNDFLSNLQ